MSQKRHSTTLPETLPKLKMAPRVTSKHGDAFALEWFEETMSVAMSDAFWRADVMEWPGYDPVDESIYTPAQQRFHAIEGEILERTFKAAQYAISEAFVKVAKDVLARERERQK